MNQDFVDSILNLLTNYSDFLFTFLLVDVYIACPVPMQEPASHMVISWDMSVLVLGFGKGAYPNYFGKIGVIVTLIFYPLPLPPSLTLSMARL